MTKPMWLPTVDDTILIPTRGRTNFGIIRKAEVDVFVFNYTITNEIRENIVTRRVIRAKKKATE